MRIRILGAGWYGCHLTAALTEAGHEVELHELADHLFAGASGANPARLHLGFHYPRSRLTRAACQDHFAAFMARYGAWTRCVPINLYGVAANDSLVDFGTYQQVLRGEVEFVTVHAIEDFGLRHLEGALLTGERHIVIRRAREGFAKLLGDRIRFGIPAMPIDSRAWDATIDCTFCALDAENVQRYEPCVTGILAGPVDRALTVMDGPFPSIYPWDEEHGLNSLTSATLTPLIRTGIRAEAEAVLKAADAATVDERCAAMLALMAHFWPAAPDLYKLVGARLSIRAMPRSGADARLVDVIRIGKRALRVRAGKIDAIMQAEQLVREMLPCLE